MQISRRQAAWAALAAMLTSLGLAFSSLWFLVLPGLALFFFSIKATTPGGSAWLPGLLFGTMTGGAGIVWFFGTLPLDFLFVHDAWVQRGAVTLTWLYVSFSLGLPVALAAVGIARLPSNALFPLWTSLLWLVAEWGRMWSFSLFTWGPNSLLGAHFSAAAVGYALTENPWLLQAAFPLGLHALNFVAALWAAWLVGWARMPRQRLASSAVCLGLLLGLAAVSAFFPQGPPGEFRGERLRVAVISENIEDVRDFSTHDQVAKRLAEAAAQRPPVDVIVLPEEFGLTSIFWSEPEARAFLNKHFGDREVLILNTRNRLYPAEEKNDSEDMKRLVFESTTRGELARYEKQLLMPLGEYRPALARLFFSVIADEELNEFVESIETAPPRNPALIAHGFKGVKLGALLCADLLSPSLYRSLSVDAGADVLINLANQFWFHGSERLHQKTKQMARVHAVQNRKKLLLADNMAPAFALDEEGRLLREARWNSPEVLYFDVP